MDNRYRIKMLGKIVEDVYITFSEAKSFIDW